MTPVRLNIIRASLAELMNAAKPMLTPEYRLKFDIKQTVIPAPTDAEFDHVISRMEAAGQIVRHRTEDEGVKTKLTEVGEAELLKF